MSISAAQLRAARALVDWSQDELAQNAQVARATIADFERKTSFSLMRQNLVSVMSALEAGGVEFIPETEEGAGAGVRLRTLEFEYSKTVKPYDGGLFIYAKYKGTPCRVFITREVLDDLDGVRSRASDDERRLSTQNHLPKFIVAAERKIIRGGANEGGSIVLGHSDFPDGTFG